MNIKGSKKKNQVLSVNIFEQQEIIAKADAIKAGLKASTRHELETVGKFDKNDKLSFVSDDMLILGCDIGSETHYVRAIDTGGRELSKSAFPFSNTAEGFKSMLDWSTKLAAANDKKQIVLGLEPTGHYRFCLTTWPVAKGISVVQVNPYAVKQTKEFRRLSMFRDQLNEDRIWNLNRLHREMKIYFPEYKDAFGKIDGAFSLELFKAAPFPDELAALGTEGMKQIWHEAKLRGRGYANATSILEYARKSVGIKDGADAGRQAVKWFVSRIIELDEQLSEIENRLNQRCMKIPHAKNILAISGIGKNILSEILAEMGDISRFDDVKEIQKLSGLGLVACSPGKHTGETKISHRGCKRLRYWLFQAAKSVVAHSEEFKELHVYYTTRKQNPLKKMQSLIVIACKILRVIFTILTKGTTYDPKKLLGDIVRPDQAIPQAA